MKNHKIQIVGIATVVLLALSSSLFLITQQSKNKQITETAAKTDTSPSGNTGKSSKSTTKVSPSIAPPSPASNPVAKSVGKASSNPVQVVQPGISAPTTQTPLPNTLLPAYPNVATTGVPLGLSIGTSKFNFFGEGITDYRPVESLAIATQSNTGMSAPDANGLVYLPNTTSNQVYDHIDFTNLKVVVPPNVLSVTFNKCRFRTTNAAYNADRAQGANLVQVLGANTAISVVDSTLDGSLSDPHYAIQLFLSTPSGNTSSAGVTFLRNNISGFSTGLSLGRFNSYHYEGNYVHDLLINKSADSGTYSNSAVWTHVDGFQIGATNYVGSGEIINNTLIGFSATNQIATGPMQIGQMAGPGTATIDSFVFSNNYLDGGGYMVGANLNTPILVNRKFEVVNNKFGLNYVYGIDSANTVHSIATLWSGNSFYTGGTGRSNNPEQVTAGQVIP